MKDKHENYPLYSPSLEEKSFFDWPIRELDLSDRSKELKQTTRPAIIRPKVNISEKVLIDSIQKLDTQAILNLIAKEYFISESDWREINAGGDYHRWVVDSHQLTKQMVILIIQQVFEVYKERERLRKEKELKDTRPEIVVLSAKELLHSSSP